MHVFGSLSRSLVSQVVKYIPAVGRRWYCSRLIGLLEWYTMGWMIDNIPARWGTSGLFIRPASDCRLTFNVHVSFAFFQALNRPDPNVLRHVRGRDYGTKLPKQPASKHDAQSQILPPRLEAFIFVQFCKASRVSHPGFGLLSHA